MNRVKVGYFCPFKSGLIIHTILTILQRLIQLCSIIGPVKIADTMCLLIYCVKFGYFWPLKSDLIRHTLLDITLRLIHFCFVI